MNARQQQLIDELTQEFDRLNSSNTKVGKLINIGAYIDEFNQSEVMKKEVEAYNNAIQKEAQEIFLEEAFMIQNDLYEMGIYSTVKDDRWRNFYPSFVIELHKHGSVTIRLQRRSRYVTIPNGEHIERTDKFVVTISHSDSEFDSIQSMVDNSDAFKSHIRKALQYTNKK